MLRSQPMDVETRQSIERLRDEMRQELAASRRQSETLITALRDDIRLVVQRLVVLTAKLDSRHR
jgi:hypothetical protein